MPQGAALHTTCHSSLGTLKIQHDIVALRNSSGLTAISVLHNTCSVTASISSACGVHLREDSLRGGRSSDLL